MADTGEPLDWTLHATELRQQIERFLGHLEAAKRRAPTSADATWQPSVDVYEHEGRLVIIADLAGADPGETQVLVDGQTLTIKGRRTPRCGPDGAVYHLMEIGGGHFDRVIHLPVTVEASRARARLMDGILEVNLPVLPRARSASVRVRVSRSRRHAKRVDA